MAQPLDLDTPGCSPVLEDFEGIADPGTVGRILPRLKGGKAVTLAN